MKRKTVYALALLCTLPLLSQKRRQKPTPKDFPTSLRLATQAWNENRFGACIQHLDRARVLAMRSLRKSLLALMPPAPEGWKKKEAKKERDGDDLALQAMGLGSLAGIEQVYEGPGGKRGKITIQANSPLIKMFAGFIQMAQFDKNSEIIEYESHKAIFKKEGERRFSLQILLWSKHLIQVEWPAMDEDAFFKIFDQAFVDRIAKALGR